MSQKRDCSLREKQAQATGVADSSSWPTPTATDAGYVPDLIIETNGLIRTVSPEYVAAGSGGQFPLGETARVWTVFWLTLKAAGWQPTRPTGSSLPVRVSFKHGRSSFYGGLMPNPQFYEMIMGWPIGWTAPEVPVTAFAAWLRRSRGQFSRLLTTFTTEPGNDG